MKKDFLIQGIRCRVVHGHPDYAVSRNGDIFRLTKKSSGRRRRYLVQPLRRKPEISKWGYHVACLCTKGTRQRVTIGRLILTTFLGQPPDKSYQAAHLDGNKSNNTLRNLAWVTARENSSHKKVHGTYLCGEEIHLSKLRESDVIQILALKGSIAQRKVAAQFGISQGNVCAIQTRKTWAHVAA